MQMAGEKSRFVILQIVVSGAAAAAAGVGVLPRIFVASASLSSVLEVVAGSASYGPMGPLVFFGPYHSPCSRA